MPLVPTLVLLLCLPARAQEPAETSDDYSRGIALLEAGDALGARARFEAAVEAEPRSEHVLALAATLQELGEPTAAIGWYDRLLAGEFGALNPERVGAIEAARERARSQQATVVIAMGGGRRADIELDDRVVGAIVGGSPLTLRLDGGAHSLRAVRGAARSPVVTFEVVASATTRVEVEAPIDVGGEGAAPAPPVAERGVDPAPWVLLGIAAIPVGVGIGAAIAYDGAADRFDAAANHRDAAQHASQAETFGTLAAVSFSVAGAIAIVSVVWGVASLAEGS